jgi:hypothetical protein
MAAPWKTGDRWIRVFDLGDESGGTHHGMLTRACAGSRSRPAFIPSPTGNLRRYCAKAATNRARFKSSLLRKTPDIASSDSWPLHGRLSQGDDWIRLPASANNRMVAVGRFVRLVGGVGGQASRRDARNAAGERSSLIGAALRGPASVPVLARRVPPVRQPSPGTLLVGRLQNLWPMCDLRLPAQAARVAGAVLPVASG